MDKARPYNADPVRRVQVTILAASGRRRKDLGEPPKGGSPLGRAEAQLERVIGAQLRSQAQPPQRRRDRARPVARETRFHEMEGATEVAWVRCPASVVRCPSRYSRRMRLDEEKLEALRRWGQGLRQAGSEEYAAAGRAILMLIEEIERLRLELLRADEQLSGVDPVSRGEAAEDMEEPVASTLHDRLQRVLRRGFDSGSGPEPVEEGSGLESDRTTTSPQSWIEALRRQK
jgi:hypothetical protein